MAYLDYSFISQKITDKNADTMIKTSFKKIYTSLAKKSPYIDITALDWRTINAETKKIEEYCVTLFPYFLH